MPKPILPRLHGEPLVWPGWLRRIAARNSGGREDARAAPALQGFCLGDELADDLLRTAAELRVPVYVHTGPHSASTPTQLVLLAARHPKTRFILGHCGSTDYAADMRTVMENPQENVWYETSLARPGAVARYGTTAGSAKLIFGSSAPRHDPAFELKFLDQLWPIAEHADTYGGNLLRLLSEVAA